MRLDGCGEWAEAPAAVSNADRRGEWIPDSGWTVRTETKEKSMRIRLPDDTAVDLYFTAEGAEKSAVSLQHRGLPDKKTADAMKIVWGDRLGALHDYLTGG